jgi:pyruvate, water dikinase
MNSPYIVWLDEVERTSSDVVGGKFGSLAEMTRNGFAVPPGFAVTTEAYRRFMASSGLAERAEAARAVDSDDLAAAEAASAGMTAAIQAAELPADVEGAIREAYERMAETAGAPKPPVAVRSSAVAEDLAGASFAGQYETFLWILGADEVVAHVKRCWTGLFSVPALTYHRAEASATDPGMAVGVQLMVTPRAAGVMFTLDPLNGDRSRVVIEAAWGLGEAVVGGEVNPDRYAVNKVTFDVLVTEIATKDAECRFDPETRSVRMVPVPEERRDAPCLEDADLVELVTLGKRVEAHWQAPMDIEWAVDDGHRIHVLQVRPETVWSQKPREPLGQPGVSGIDRVLGTFMARTAGPPGAGEDEG